MGGAQTLYGGGWISRQSTGGLPLSRATATVVIASAFMVGTGGIATADYIAKRSERGYKFYQVHVRPLHQGTSPRTPAESLAHVRSVLRPAVSELASLLGVSRQAVYDWQGGAQPAPENAARLEDLAAAADVFIAEGLPVTPYVLNRRLRAGKTLFEIVRDGGSAADAARSLIEIVRHEVDERHTLNSRLATRIRPPMDQSDLGVPGFDERT